MPQYQASFCIPALYSYATSKQGSKLWHAFNHFLLVADAEIVLPNQHIEPLASVLSNLISRGLPTYSSSSITNHFQHSFDDTLKDLELTTKVTEVLMNAITPKSVEYTLVKKSERAKYLELALAPIAIARIQKTILEFLRAGHLAIDEERWSIGIIERDIPCAKLAIKDFQELLSNILLLEGKGRTIPTIDLTILVDTNFTKPKLLKNRQVEVLQNYKSTKEFDLLLDVATLSVKSMDMSIQHIKSSYKATVRSIPKPKAKTNRHFYKIPPIRYHRYANGLVHKEALAYFSNYIFRDSTLITTHSSVISQLLANQHTLTSLPNQTHRFQVLQIVGLLQATQSVLISDKSYVNFSNSLKKLGIDAIQKLSSKTNNLPSLFNYTNISYFQNNWEFPSKWTQNIGLCIVDNAEKSSLWSPLFEEKYLQVLKKLKQSWRAKNILWSIFVNIADNNVLKEIEHSLEVEHTVLQNPVYLNNTKLSFLKIKILETEEQDANTFMRWQRQVKQNRLEVLLGMLTKEVGQNGDVSIYHNPLDNPPSLFRHEGIPTDFAEGRTNALCLTYWNMPASLEHFVHHTSGRDPRYNYLFYNDQKTFNAWDTNAQKWNYDEHLLWESFNRNLKSRDKESTILTELLQQISCPDNTVKEGIEVHLWAMGEGETLTYSIPLYNDISANANAIIGNLYQQGAISYSIELVTLHGEIHYPKLDGYLLKHAVQVACEITTDLSSFIRKVNELYERSIRAQHDAGNLKYKKYNIQIKLPFDADQRNRINDLLLKTRYPQDTYTAIHRLMVLNIIDNYILDDQQIKIQITKKSDDEYIFHLLNYLQQFESLRVIQERVESIQTLARHSVLQQCVQHLLHFLYPSVNEVKRQHIESIQTAYHLGAQQGFRAFKNYITSYFNGKYASLYHSPNLIEDTQGGSDAQISILWKYLDVLEHGENTFMYRLEQLQQSANILQQRHPNNPIFMLLQGFCIMYSEIRADGNPKVLHTLKEGVDLFINGFLTYKRLHQVTPKDFTRDVELFKYRLLDQHPMAESIVENAVGMLFVEMQRRFISEFKDSFLSSTG